MMARKVALIFLIFFNLSTTYHVEDVEELLLTEFDLILEKQSNSPDAPLHNRQNSNENLVPSYNQWLCYWPQYITLTCSEHDFGNKIIKTPMIAVDAYNEAFEIETSPADEVNCQDVLSKWKSLLPKGEPFCVLAAYLQDLPNEGYGDTDYRSLWIVEALKSLNGSWYGPRLKNY